MSEKMIRSLSFTLVTLILWAGSAGAEVILPVGSAPKALDFPHFPSRMHTFIWRNWPVVSVDRLAQVLGASVEEVRTVAESMGLPPQQPIPAADQERIYITLIRRNWHLLPYDQLLTLLGFSAEQLAYSLREDDFLFSKLGLLKPQCEPLRYLSPDASAKRRCEEIKKFVQDTFGDELQKPAEPRFQFVRELSRLDSTAPISEKTKARFSPRIIFSYFALYGDPLMNPQLDPYPDGLLQKLSALGVDGVWMQAVLRQLAPSPLFPEFGAGSETRLKNLRELVQRAKKYHVGIYLYINEPRAMPKEFFADRPNLKGVQEDDYYTMCTSAPEVRQWLADSLAYVFEKVPDLAGVLTITASENLTNCASHGQSAKCPRCKPRQAADIIAEVNSVIEAGVHRGNPKADVLVWDWGWDDKWAEAAIGRLPKSVRLMSVSEWSKPITRGGISTNVGEYSLSAVGPGPRAVRHWAAAKKAGLKTVAKVQVNCSWELSAAPYLPVLDLIAEHCKNLISTDVSGLMLSWTVGGYPSPNLELVHQFDRDPAPTAEAALEAVARARFGSEGAPFARKAWMAFSNAFQEYPYSAQVLYQSPIQMGPANLLYAVPTGYPATMVGIPYDDVAGWRGVYPPEVFAEQYTKIAAGWDQGLADLEQAVLHAPPEKQDSARSELRFARAAQYHFASVANQTRFTVARDLWLDKNKNLAPQEREATFQKIRLIAQDEVTLARKLFTLASEDSRIGYEASNQYYYLPIDLVEKALDCRYILDRFVD